MNMSLKRLKEIVVDEYIKAVNKMDEVSEGQLVRWKIFVDGYSKPFVVGADSSNKAKQLAHQMIRNSSVKIAKVVREGIITEWKHNFPGFSSKEYDVIQNWIDMGSLSQTIAMYKKNKKSFTQFIKDAARG